MPRGQWLELALLTRWNRPQTYAQALRRSQGAVLHTDFEKHGPRAVSYERALEHGLGGSAQVERAWFVRLRAWSWLIVGRAADRRSSCYGSSRSRCGDPVIERLVGEREVVAVDLPGMGASPPLPNSETPSVEALAGAVAAWFRLDGLQRPHVAGNSLGGASRSS